MRTPGIASCVTRIAITLKEWMTSLEIDDDEDGFVHRHVDVVQRGEIVLALGIGLVEAKGIVLGDERHRGSRISPSKPG